MSEQRTKPSMATALERIAVHEDQLTWKFPNGDIYARLGLILTVYFAKGYSAEGRDRIAKCFEHFVKLYGDHLKGKQFSGESDGNYVALRKGDVQKLAEKARSLKPNYALGWHLSSEATQDIAPEYSIDTLTSQGLLEDRDGNRSYLKVCLPWRILKEKNDLQIYLEFVHFVCSTLKVEHGYSGLSVVLPYNFDKCLFIEREAAEKFSGLMIDTYALMGNRGLKNHSIKGVNWLTIIGTELLGKLGGKDQVLALLRQPGIEARDYEDGVTLQAGEAPSLGASEEGLPPLYVAVNKVLKPIRIKDPDQLHHYMPDRIGFDKAATLAWYARFDTNEPEAAAASDRLRGLPGEVVPRGGIWHTPALKGAAGLRVFAAGERFPPTQLTDWGQVIWSWRGDPDPHQNH